MKPLRSGCRVRVHSPPFSESFIGTIYLPQDCIRPDLVDYYSGHILVIFTPDHRQRATAMRILGDPDVFNYHNERYYRKEQIWVREDTVEVVRSGTRRGKKHRMRVGGLNGPQ